MSVAIEQVLHVVVRARQLVHFYLLLDVDGLQFLVERLHFLLRGGQLLVGGLQFLVGGFQLLLRGLHLLLGDLHLLAQPLGFVLEFGGVFAGRGGRCAVPSRRAGG